MIFLAAFMLVTAKTQIEKEIQREEKQKRGLLRVILYLSLSWLHKSPLVRRQGNVVALT